MPLPLRLRIALPLCTYRRVQHTSYIVEFGHKLVVLRSDRCRRALERFPSPAIAHEGCCPLNIRRTGLLFTSSHGREGTKHVRVLGVRRLAAWFQVSSSSDERGDHALEVSVLQGFFRRDSTLRIVSQKPHHEVYTSITDKRELLTEQWWLGRRKRDCFCKREIVILRPRVPTGRTEQFEYHGYHLNFTFRLEQWLFEDKFCEYAADGPHVYGGRVGCCPE